MLKACRHELEKYTIIEPKPTTSAAGSSELVPDRNVYTNIEFSLECAIIDAFFLTKASKKRTCSIGGEESLDEDVSILLQSFSLFGAGKALEFARRDRDIAFVRRTEASSSASRCGRSSGTVDKFRIKFFTTDDCSDFAARLQVFLKVEPPRTLLNPIVGPSKGSALPWSCGDLSASEPTLPPAVLTFSQSSDQSQLTTIEKKQVVEPIDTFTSAVSGGDCSEFVPPPIFSTAASLASIQQPRLHVEPVSVTSAVVSQSEPADASVVCGNRSPSLLLFDSCCSPLFRKSSDARKLQDPSSSLLSSRVFDESELSMSQLDSALFSQRSDATGPQPCQQAESASRNDCIDAAGYRETPPGAVNHTNRNGPIETAVSALSNHLLSGNMPLLYDNVTSQLPKENLDVFVRLCLMDSNFPGFCEEVKRILEDF